MIELLKNVKKYALEMPEKVAIVDQAGNRKTSYSDLYTMSGRLASWLLKQGIRREKVVAIRTPRGVHFSASRLAVMMIGACWVGVEDMMGAERIEYIIKDSGAVLTIDEQVFEEAMKEEPLSEDQCVDPDQHDMAFIFYTSGSTGRAKGVVQEYGIYKNILTSTYRCIGDYVPLNYANVAPETFIGGLYLMSGILNTGNTLHIIPLELVRDPMGLIRYFRENEIQATCMPPTLIKVLEKMGGLNLKILHITGEIATDLYIDRFPMMNAYGPTEFSYLPFFFDIDKPYKNTPIGTPDDYTNYILIDENGKKNTKEGVLCIELPYFRGYLHDEKKEYMIEVDSVTYFKTGDYVTVDESGNVTILGRVDDMVKINGNRIEPSEVEFAVKKVLDTDFAAVKVWERGGSQYMCAYHRTGKELDAQEMAEKLKSLLPSYMIPACYIAIDEIPLNDNGKVNKRALPEPDDNSIFATYAAPENAAENKLCELFSSVLKIRDHKIGIDDDFFLLGGDSVAAITMVVTAGDPGLTVPMIYKERTVRKIAAALDEVVKSDYAVDRERHYPLSDEQRYFLEQELTIPGRVIYNLPVMLNFDKNLDEVRLYDAVKHVWAAHPALHTVIEKTENGWEQRVSENYELTGIKVVSEDELDEEVKNFVKPLFGDGSQLFRMKLFRTPERVVLLLDVHHIICDGESMRIVVEDILSAYDGDDIASDSYFSFLNERDQIEDKVRKADREYFRNAYREDYDRLPKPDFQNQDHRNEDINWKFAFGQDDILKAAKRLHVSAGTFYMLASAMAIAAYNNTDRSMITWNYNGRSDIRTMRTVGLLIRDYPAAMSMARDVSVKTLAAKLSKQQSAAILHGSVSPFMERGKDEMLCFLYQGKLMEEPEKAYLKEIDYPEAAEQTAIEPLELKIYEDGDSASMEINYDAGMYSKESMERFVKIYDVLCHRLLEEHSEDMIALDLVKRVQTNV